MHAAIAEIVFGLFNLIVGFAVGRLAGSTHVPSALRAPWTPPSITFAIVWSIAFYLLGGAYYRIWTSPHSNRMRKFDVLVHFALIHAWTPIFFYFKQYDHSLIVMTGVVVFTLQLAFSDINAKQTMFKTLFWTVFISWLVYAFSLNIYATSMFHRVAKPVSTYKWL